MEKRAFVSILVALLVLLPMTAFASYTVSPQIVVEQGVSAGVVKVTGNADGSLTLDYSLKGWAGWCIRYSAVHVGLTLDDFPMGKVGASPIRFDYQFPFGECGGPVGPNIVAAPCTTYSFNYQGGPMMCVTSATRVIEDPPGDRDALYIAIYGIMTNPDGEREIGWAMNADGGLFPGRNGSAYFVFPANAWY